MTISGANTSEFADRAIAALASMRFLDPVPGRMRRPAFPGQTVLGDRGENLPTVLASICASPERKNSLIEWVREPTPMDVRDFEFPRDSYTGRIHLFVRNGEGKQLSADSISDGTLRFLAVVAAMLSANTSSLDFSEEIDAGIHSSRQWLLADFIEKQTEALSIQAVATTHSPSLLAKASDKTFDHTSVVCRLANSETAFVRPLKDLSNAVELRKTQGLGRLLEGAWMETTLEFMKNENPEENGE